MGTVVLYLLAAVALSACATTPAPVAHPTMVCVQRPIETREKGFEMALICVQSPPQ